MRRARALFKPSWRAPACNRKSAIIRVEPDDKGKKRTMAFDGSRAQLYREQARRLREIAGACTIPEMHDQLMRIAWEYDKLARQVDKGHLPR
jgi:hypothetical protein